MNEEKEMCGKLPQDKIISRVQVTDGDKLFQEAFPEPKPLVGASTVYQKSRLPEYYCRIKDGRDEFMHLYFGDLTEHDVDYTVKGIERIYTTVRQQKLRTRLLNALDNKPKEGVWIPVYEPSRAADGQLQFVPNMTVLRFLTCNNWENLMQDYSPENGSRMASPTTYFLLLLKFIKLGFVTLEDCADDSSSIGNYCDSPYTSRCVEKTGSRWLGGLSGFAGNTYKIVKDSNSFFKFMRLGGCCNNLGYQWPLMAVACDFLPDEIIYHGVGLLELTH